MLRIEIPNIVDFEEIRKEFIKANDSAITVAAAAAVTGVRAAQPVRTGRLVSQVGIKFFAQKNGCKGAAVKVIGDRHFVAHILEYGSKHIKAQQNFARAFAAIEERIHSVYMQEFLASLEKL